jgi:hypothetical protein
VCVLGPSVNTWRAQLDFPSKPNFTNWVEFSTTDSLKNQYLSHLSSENCEMNSVKSDSLRAFQKHRELPHKIPIQFSVLILFNSHWEKGSIFNSFHTIAPNSLKPSQCTSTTHWELSEDTKSAAWNSHGLEDLSMTRQYKTKQNKTKGNYLAS